MAKRKNLEVGMRVKIKKSAEDLCCVAHGDVVKIIALEHPSYDGSLSTLVETEAGVVEWVNHTDVKRIKVAI